MSILVIAEIANNKYKKSTFEAVTFAKQSSANIGGEVEVLSIGALDAPDAVGVYGASKVHHLNQDVPFDTAVYASLIVQD